MQHLEEGTIHAWLDGALTGDEQARVEQHVQQCAECAAMVAEARGIIAGAARIVRALDIVPGGVIPKQRTAAPGSGSLWRSLRLTPFRAALAASLMIAAASLVTVRRNAATEFDAARADKAEALSAPAPAASPLPASPTPAPAVAMAEAPTLAKTRAGAAADAKVPAEANAQASTGGAKAAGTAKQSRANSVARQALSGVVATAESKKPDSLRASSMRLRDAVAASAPAIPPAAVATNEARRSAQDKPRDSRVAGSVRATANAVARELPKRADMESARQLVMPNVLSMDAAGCYQVSRDSNAVFSALPERFAFERSPSERSARNVIHAIDTAGRLDTAVVGTWRDVSANLVMVNLTAGSTQQALTLAKTVTGFTVQPVSSFAPSSPVRIVRTNCPR